MILNRWGKLFILGIAVIQAGCVSGTRKVVSVSHELPADLPKEFKDKFEIREISESAGMPTGMNETQEQARSRNLPQSQLQGSSKGKSKEPSKSPSKSVGLKKKGLKGVAAGVSNSAADLASDSKPPFVYPVRRGALGKKDPIWIAEKLVYSIKYFGVSAGDFTLEVLPFKILANRKVYHIRGTGVSSPIFSVFYRLNDVVETFFDYEGNFSHRFHIVLDETKQKRDALELYDSEKRQTYYWNRWHPKDSEYKETKELASIEPFSQDSVSSLYYLRTVPLPAGSVVSFPVVSEGKSWEAMCTIVRRESLDTVLGSVPTVVIKLEMKFQGVVKKMGESFLWLTDDDRRIPVRLEAKVKVGTVSAELRKAELGTPPEEMPQSSIPQLGPNDAAQVDFPRFKLTPKGDLGLNTGNSR